MLKKVTVVFLFVLMALGIAVAIANFISVHAHAAIPCIKVRYHSELPDCYGEGADCWDCTPNPPKD